MEKKNEEGTDLNNDAKEAVPSENNTPQGSENRTQEQNSLVATSEVKEEGAENTENTEEIPYDNKNNIDQSDMKNFRYGWLNSDLATFAILLLVFSGYTWFSIREEKIFEIVEIIRWGGSLDRIQNLKKALRILRYDMFGIDISDKLIAFGLVESVVLSLYDSNEKTLSYAMEILCLLSRSEHGRQQIHIWNGYEAIRRHIHSKDEHLLYTLSNLAKGNSEFARLIASDDYIMPIVFKSIRDNKGIDIMLRPSFGILEGISRDKEALTSLTKYKEDVRYCIFEAMSTDSTVVRDTLNVFMKIKEQPDLELYEVIKDHVDDVSNDIPYSDLPYYIDYGKKALLVLSCTALFSQARGAYLRRAYRPLSSAESTYLTKIQILGPLAAVPVSFTWNLFEWVTKEVKEHLEMESVRDVRTLQALYWVMLPLYAGVFHLCGPYFVLPSLYMGRYRDQEPPRYMSFLRNSSLFGDTMKTSYVNIVNSQEYQPPLNPKQIIYLQRQAIDSLSKE